MARRDEGILLSEQHGVNPMITKCFWCGAEKNEIVLLGKLKGDVAAPRTGIIDQEPCAECAEHMKKGVMFISVDSSKTPSNPQDAADFYRTGAICVVSEEAVRKLIIQEEMIKFALERRVMFMDDEAWDMADLPRPYDTKGHWTVNGVCACESELTADVLYWDGNGDEEDFERRGRQRPLVCHTTYGEFLKMRTAVCNHHNGDVHCRWVMGPCKKEGAR